MNVVLRADLFLSLRRQALPSIFELGSTLYFYEQVARSFDDMKGSKKDIISASIKESLNIYLCTPAK